MWIHCCIFKSSRSNFQFRIFVFQCHANVQNFWPWFGPIDYAEWWYWPEEIWWRSTEDSVCPQSDSKVSLDAWHETVWRMWPIHSCSQKTSQREDKLDITSCQLLNSQKSISIKLNTTHRNRLHGIHRLQKQMCFSTTAFWQMALINTILVYPQRFEL